MDHGRGESNLLGHARGVVDDELVAVRQQVHRPQQVLGTRGDGVAVETPEQAGVGDELGAGEPVEEANAVGQHAEALLRDGGVGPHVGAEDRRRAEVRPQEARGHAERRRLTGTVGADQAVERAGRDVEADACDGDLLPEPLPQATQAQGRTRVRWRHPGRRRRGV